MAKFQDLPPDSQGWGQWIERRLTSLETLLSNLNTLVTGSNSRLSSLLNQQTQIVDQQGTLGDQQATLSEQQTTLGTQQTTLTNQQTQISAQVAFLLNQTVSADAYPADWSIFNHDPGTNDVPVTWLPFNSTADASVQFTTSSTGRVTVEAGGYLSVESYEWCETSGYIGVQALNIDGTVIGPQSEIGFSKELTAWGKQNSQNSLGSGVRFEWQMTPNTPFIIRCRRGYAVGGSSLANARAKVWFYNTTISVTKLGM